MNTAAGILLALLAPIVTAAQEVVPVNLYVADLTYDRGSIRVSTPVKLTGDRGVNSQPSFTPDGKAILFVGRRDSANAQSDVYRIDLATRAETRITSTAEMENSPTVTPEGNLMVIRWVPATLFTEWGPWIYDMQGRPLRGVLPRPDTVGYYVRADSITFAMVRPRSPSAIALFDIRKGTMTERDFPVANIPPQVIPGQRAVSYTVTDSAGRNLIRRLDIASGDTSTITAAVLGRVAHAWTPRGEILMGRGNRIFARVPARDSSWREVAAFADPELQSITTYVVSPQGDKVILISPAKPALQGLIRDSLQAGRAMATAIAGFTKKTLAELARTYEVSEGGLLGLANEQRSRAATDRVRLLELAAGLYPASHTVQMQLGAAYRDAGDKTRAIRAYQRSLELNPRLTEAQKRDATRVEEALKAAGSG